MPFPSAPRASTGTVSSCCLIVSKGSQGVQEKFKDFETLQFEASRVFRRDIAKVFEGNRLHAIDRTEMHKAIVQVILCVQPISRSGRRAARGKMKKGKCCSFTCLQANPEALL